LIDKGKIKPKIILTHLSRYCVILTKIHILQKIKDSMAGKTKLQLEYIVNCSPKVLFNRLSTAAGLTEWFADDVRVKGNIFTFVWGESGEEAEKKIHKENKMVRYEWIGSDLDKDESYFEFVIAQDDLTNDVSLLVVDFADEDEEEQTEGLWNSQVAKLKQLLGS
jgi:uncharacterized protein YndB with AHSA1/START domain